MPATDFQPPLDARARPDATGRLASLAAEMVWRLPGCADVSVRLALQSAWREFCDGSECLRFPLRAPLERGRRVYPVAAPYGASVRRVAYAALERPGDIRRLREGEDFAVRNGTPPAIALAREPGDPGAEPPPFLIALLVLRPVRGSEDIPPDLLDRHGDAIVHGAMWRLLSMQGRPWSDPAAARDERTAFDNAMHEAAYTDLGEAFGHGPMANPLGWA